jgi:hypothetical protein
MNANFSEGNLNISIFTNYHGTEEIVAASLKTYPADLFIDIGLDGNFDYGVALSDHAFDNELVASSPGNLYSNITYRTSADYFENHSVYNYYGEAWDNPWDNVSNSVAVPETIDEGTLVSGPNGFSWDLLSEINPGYLVSLSLSLNDLSIQGAEDIGFLFSSANCANDIIAGSVHYPAPEPATMLLVGIGLIGLGMVSKRRFLHKAQEMDGLRVPPSL